MLLLFSHTGLGVEKNKTLGCDLINQANTLLPLNPTMTYYQGLCFLHQRRFDEANNRFFSACMSQFVPAIDSVIRMKELKLGQKIKMDLSSYLGATMASRLREKYSFVVDVSRKHMKESCTIVVISLYQSIFVLSFSCLFSLS